MLVKFTSLEWKVYVFFSVLCVVCVCFTLLSSFSVEFLLLGVYKVV